MVKSNRREKYYFKYVNPIWVILAVNGYYLLWAGIFAPDQIPRYFGPLGTLSQTLGKDYDLLMKILFFSIIIIHSVESIYAVIFCRQLHLDSSSTVKWWIQTLIMGMISFKLLYKYSMKIKT